MDGKLTANMERVLRAMDVIPPLDDGIAHSRLSTDPVPSSAKQVPPPCASGGDPVVFAPDVSPRKADAHNVPTYDLAQNILAQQRRVASAKRRGPGQPHEPPLAVQKEQPSPAAPVAEPPAQELADLERIVAQIVARDIERLCKGPAKMQRLPAGV